MAISKKDKLLKDYVSIFKKTGTVTVADLKKAGYTYKIIEYHFCSLSNLRDEAIKKYPEMFSNPKVKVLSKKDKLLKDYIDLYEKLGKVSLNDLKTINQTPDMITHHYGSLSKLEAAARKKYPEAFNDIKVEDIISKERTSALHDTINSHSRFLITTAVVGCKVDTNALAAIKTWEKTTGGIALFMVASDPAHNTDPNSMGRIDSTISGENIIYKDVYLNDNIFLSTIKLNAKAIDPITGLGRIGQRKGSYIFASPKQRLKYVPTSNNSIPRSIMTTGAITTPDYGSSKYAAKRTAYLAESDHIMGGVIVEIQDDKIFHFRQVQFDSEDGSFIDLCEKYSGSSVTGVNMEAFVMGDLHSGETCMNALSVWREICKTYNPKFIVLHDSFNGRSINHHEMNNIVVRSQNASNGFLSLKDELIGLAKDLDEISTWCEQLVITKSNHDIFLDRYLQEGKYIYDAHNHGVSLKIADALVNDNKDPLQYAIEELITIKAKNLIWLKTDTDFYVGGIQVGAHGHKGANGARGSAASMENAYGSSVSGHTHTAEIYRGVWVCGTSTLLRLNYTQGPSSWTQTSCIIYPNGNRQLINVIEGNWKI